MSKSKIDTPTSLEEDALGIARSPIRLVLNILLCLIVLVIAWQGVAVGASDLPDIPLLPRTIYILFGLMILTLVLAFSLQRVLIFSPLNLKPAWTYRLGFLISAGLAVGLWSPDLLRAGTPQPVWMVGGVIGAFLGGLLASGLTYGFWEENLPPSQLVKEEVRAFHLKVIGQPRVGPRAKHLFDFLLAAFGIVIFMPLSALIAFIIWFQDPGPVIFVKNSVGKGGINFQQLKFRTMVRDAEALTGPILAGRDDRRILWIGRFLRKTALDELPQLVNILRLEMSFVGPRPQRTVLVHQYLQDIPRYAHRHTVRPGISGLAQVVGHYYISPLQKLRFDLIYIHHVGLAFDLKLLFVALVIVFWLRWQKDWNGHTPQSWLRLGKRWMHTSLYQLRWFQRPRLGALRRPSSVETAASRENASGKEDYLCN